MESEPQEIAAMTDLAWGPFFKMREGWVGLAFRPLQEHVLSLLFFSSYFLRNGYEGCLGRVMEGTAKGKLGF